MHLYTSTYSSGYFFTWDKSLAFGQALKSLKIEGNLNRFAAVSAWLERNASLMKLRDLGNSLIVVEHDEDTMRAADCIVDIGPVQGSMADNWLPWELQRI